MFFAVGFSAPLGLGRHLFFREIGDGSWIVIVVVIAAILLIRFWPAIAAWLQRVWRSR